MECGASINAGSRTDKLKLPKKGRESPQEKLSNPQAGDAVLLRIRPLSNKAAKFHTRFYSMWEGPHTIFEQRGNTLRLEDKWENIRKVQVTHVKQRSLPEYMQDAPVSQPIEQLTALMQPDGDIDPVRQQCSPVAASITFQEALPTPDLPPLQVKRSTDTTSSEDI
ncbi:hypothetical protein PR048_025677 [Dryococelus australis]|uniref:Uncharacterized protein n=1 Tax=Dryococelus australis TaxID=614101 RepID=A0ABQ9GJ36_9NEOP|nr:hypothetical protein PR048_025677 [Dryococelus australis]